MNYKLSHTVSKLPEVFVAYFLVPRKILHGYLFAGSVRTLIDESCSGPVERRVSYTWGIYLLLCIED
jgi:hypothetical protein